MYQIMLILLLSLVFIWTLRQVYAGQAVQLKDSFYRSMTPLVQFMLVVLVVLAQLLPLSIGLLIYSTAAANGLAVTILEQLLLGLLALILSAVSLYMLSSSFFALYIVTLPDMTPLAALRSARQLVRGRRLPVLLRILFLPFVMIVAAAAIIMPLILFVTPLAALVFYAITLLIWPLVHSYMYTLYRSML
jgi:hypothetical protein